MPLASRGLIALPPNMPKKNTATRLASSLFVYQVDSVYMPPGMYPASQRPKKARETRNPVLFLTKTCIVATNPKMKTWAEIHFRGPMRCKMMFEGISKTTMPRNISWLPRLIVLWFTLIFFAKPSVSALARFVRSSWKTSRPRKSNGRTVVSTLVRQQRYQNG
jgi:hypothetical protein